MAYATDYHSGARIGRNTQQKSQHRKHQDEDDEAGEQYVVAGYLT
jgi:hypothetical protein